MKISILVITYNHEKYIAKAIEGIAIQNELQDYEIVVADDHSHDQTIAIAKQSLEQFCNVKYIVNETNVGITKNYQHAFKHCKGEYIFVLEGDDYWVDPNKIKKQVSFLDQHPMCVMCAHPFIMQQEDTGVYQYPELSKQAFDFPDVKELIINPGIIGNFSTCCYRNSILQKIPAETYAIKSYDWFINICMGDLGMIGRINDAMSVYRIVSSGAWSGISSQDKLQGLIAIIDKYNAILENRYYSYFKQKQDLLSVELLAIQPQKATHRKADFIPPFILKAAKLFIPPYFLNK